MRKVKNSDVMRHGGAGSVGASSLEAEITDEEFHDCCKNGSAESLEKIKGKIEEMSDPGKIRGFLLDECTIFPDTGWSSKEVRFLVTAAKEGHANIVSYFLEKCVQLGVARNHEVFDMTLYGAAVSSKNGPGYFDVVSYLIGFADDDFALRNSALLSHGEYISMKVAKLLVAKGANVNYFDESGRSILQMIYDGIAEDTLEFFVHHNISPTKEQISARYERNLLEQEGYIKFLMSKGAILDGPTKKEDPDVVIKRQRDEIAALKDEVAALRVENTKLKEENVELKATGRVGQSDPAVSSGIVSPPVDRGSGSGPRPRAVPRVNRTLPARPLAIHRDSQVKL